MKKYVPFLMVVGAVGVMLCAGESFAMPSDGLDELKELAKMAESANKTASWIAGGTALTIGAIYSMAKQSPMAFISSLVIALGAYKGTALVTAAMVI
jgi:hypothetical protein